MAIEQKIEKLYDLIQTSMKGGKLDYATTLLNSIIDRINLDDQVIKNIKSRKINIENQKFDIFIEKCVFVMKAVGLDITEISNYDDEALIFIVKHKDKFNKPLTAKRLDSFMRLYRYYIWQNNKEPETIKDLANAYTEIEEGR